MRRSGWFLLSAAAVIIFAGVTFHFIILPVGRNRILHHHHHHHHHNAPSSYPLDDEASSWPEIAFEEKDVVLLTDENFADVTAQNGYVLVMFYAPWCVWSQKLLPEYAAAATLLNGTAAVLAKVDCVTESQICRRFHIGGYPTVTLFVRGENAGKDASHLDRTRNEISTWMKMEMGLAVRSISTTEEAQQILVLNTVTNTTTVMAYLHTTLGRENEELCAASKLHPDISFYQTNRVEVARMFEIDPQLELPPSAAASPSCSLVLLKLGVSNHTPLRFAGEFVREEIDEFVTTHRNPSVYEFNENVTQLVKNYRKQLWLFASNKSPSSSVAISAFSNASKYFKGKLPFVSVDTSDDDDKATTLGRRVALELGITSSVDDDPKMIAYIEEGDNISKYEYEGELTSTGIKEFAEEFLRERKRIPSSISMREINSSDQASNHHISLNTLTTSNNIYN